VKRRREAYVDQWLPEPLLTTPDVAKDAGLAESMSISRLSDARPGVEGAAPTTPERSPT
jgi:hypothetical protein